MSLRYKGAVISATPPTTTGGESGVASGSWTLEQQMQAQGSGNWPSPPLPKYIEDVFSTYLYTGNETVNTITNGIDLSGKGGLVWIKARQEARAHILFDTARGANYYLSTNATAASIPDSGFGQSFSSTGFGLNSGYWDVNHSGYNYASWTFRKQPKFFDVVTYTGDGNTAQDISHNLGSKPGWIILKKTSSTSNWIVLANTGGNGPLNSVLRLNTTDSQLFSQSAAITTSTTVRVSQCGNTSGNAADNMNDSGASYVMYLFAHNAGGFGLTGTDNVISCGSALGTATVNLGYEPQWVLVKNVDGGTGNWFISDNMRGLGADDTSNDALLPNLSSAEVDGYGGIKINSTGFSLVLNSTTTYIYIAIRRGPMKVPTDANTVFGPVTRNGTGAATFVSTPSGFTPDSVISLNRSGAFNDWYVQDRLRGSAALQTTGTGAEFSTAALAFSYDAMGGMKLGSLAALNSSDPTNGKYVDYYTKRAPNFMDVVCYTGTSSTNQRISHNLGVAPELIITKTRNTTNDWWTYVASSVTASGGRNKFLALDATYQFLTSANVWGTSDPTATDFGIDNTAFGYNGYNIVAYLFATCAGVSKVGSYTGNGSTQTINCGFTGGARFVLIKRTDSTGDWYVWDTARGMTTLTDPYLLLNSTAAESATLGSVTTVTTGFAVNASILAAINTSGASYVFLAIS